MNSQSNKYIINIQELKKKINDMRNLLVSGLPSGEKEKIQLSLIAYLNVLNSSSYTNFFNFLDYITKGKYSQSRFKKYECLTEDISQFLQTGNDYINEEYLQFLLTLINNIASPYLEAPNFSQIKLSNEQMIQVALSFYNYLGDEEINEIFRKIMSSPNSIIINKNIRNDNENFRGICNYDYVYNKPYIIVNKSNNIYDFYVLIHEIMHGIDFYMLPKLPSKTYYGFSEVPAYTIEYLIEEYLQNMGIYEKDIYMLKNDKTNYLKGLACQIQFDIRHKLRQNGFNVNSQNLNDIMTILDMDLINKMLEVESGIIAYGFYQQIKSNKSYGLNNLKKFMKTSIPKHKIPDFSQYGLSNEILLQLSKHFMTNANYIQQSQLEELQNQDKKIH